MGRDHLILGQLVDYLTGETIVDTHDERARQILARVLVDQGGFDRTEIESGVILPVAVDDDAGRVRIDFVVRLKETVVMVVVFGPGAIVSRQRPALAAARLLTGYAVPYVVISNGREARIMDGRSGRVIARGLEEIPSRSAIAGVSHDFELEPLSEERLDKEKRILFCMEVLSERECQSFTCNSG